MASLPRPLIRGRSARTVLRISPRVPHSHVHAKQPRRCRNFISFISKRPWWSSRQVSTQLEWSIHHCSTRIPPGRWGKRGSPPTRTSSTLPSYSAHPAKSPTSYFDSKGIRLPGRSRHQSPRQLGITHEVAPSKRRDALSHLQPPPTGRDGQDYSATEKAQQFRR